jgi:hypothetical protein
MMPTCSALLARVPSSPEDAEPSQLDGATSWYSRMTIRSRVIREYQDVAASSWLGSASSGLLGTRGSSAEHVGIMSHGHMLADLRYMMAGRAGELGDNITSSIMQVAARVQHY